MPVQIRGVGLQRKTAEVVLDGQAGYRETVMNWLRHSPTKPRGQRATVGIGELRVPDLGRLIALMPLNEHGGSDGEPIRWRESEGWSNHIGAVAIRIGL